MKSLLVAPSAAAKTVTVDYPVAGSVFPPDLVAPRLLWHDPSAADQWLIDLALDGGRSGVSVLTSAPAPPRGEIDPRALGPTNEIYEPTPYQATARSWQPEDALWREIAARAVDAPAVVEIRGTRADDPSSVLSRGRVSLRVSRDPVGAPIFYRDVPLMPSRTEKNLIKPLSDQALPLIAWRLRDVSRRESRVVLHDMPTCANCHSFSADGRTLAMDLDGPDGDKGAYAIAPLEPLTRITRDRIITWNSFPDQPRNHRTIGFLSRVSPDGRWVLSTVNEDLYVSNFTAFRFLQVFYPTRGILAYYSARTEEMKALPGADDPQYVHCDPTWSPDGKTIVFARARARDAYTPGVPLAAYPNDPNETPMRYDLYRMPFEEGRGGVPVPIAGASSNGSSNSFPKITPDGRFVVFVRSANGQLLRPDGKLWIVPIEGGEARLMECNTALMNSWHSFSPNGRWMVFSSKVNTPYTQLFLTHLDEQGHSTPPVLVPDSTAANRAANIPEFVNVPYDGLQRIEAPSVEQYLHINRATDLAQQGQWEESIAAVGKALEIDPESVKAHLLLGTGLWRTGHPDEALRHYEKAVEIDPKRAEARYSLSFALFLQDRWKDGLAQLERAFEIAPRSGKLPARYDAGVALPIPEPPRTAAETCRRKLEQDPADVAALLVLASLRAAAREDDLRDGAEAVRLARRACTLTRFQVPEALDVLGGAYAEAGRFDQAVEVERLAVWYARAAGRTALAPGAAERLALYESGRPYRRAD
ncbi:MAG: tetratricopeptide repeat protein [Vicinamibacteria bacterium]